MDTSRCATVDCVVGTGTAGSDGRTVAVAVNPDEARWLGAEAYDNATIAANSRLSRR
jgi:hypothetical protein